MQWLSSCDRLGIEGLLVLDSLEELCYVLEQDFIFCLVLVQPRKTETGRPDMTEKIVDLDIKHQHKQSNACILHNCF